MPGDYPPREPGREPGASRWRGPGPRGDRSGQSGQYGQPGQSRPGASGSRSYPSGAPYRPAPQGPTMRPGASGARPRPPFAPDRSSANIYRPYDSAAYPDGQRLPDASGRWNADPFGMSAPGGLTSSRMEAIHRKANGFAPFHDGNVGHLWRGEVMSLVGEGALSVGVIIWLAYLTASPWAVLAAVIAFGFPYVIAGPFAAAFENVREPGRMLAWLGRVRVVAALGVVAMHFLTLYPILYVLLFALGASSRIRQSLRVAATHVCLAPGELELVSNDLYIGSAAATVVGPLLGSILFLALGDRIILVGLGAALLFLLAGNSDGFLDALPEAQRGFLQATPAVVAPDDATRDDLLRAAREDGERDLSATALAAELTGSMSTAQPLTEEQRELALPEWYQQGPLNAAQAMAEIRAGLGLAGGRKSSATALLALLALALVGGGLSALEVFYLGDQLNLPALYLGVLAALEAGGLALGALLASGPVFNKMGPRRILLGLALTGIGLAIFGATSFAPLAFAAAFGMGVANALAVTGARQALRAGRDGAERRAISAAESFYIACVSLFGALLFTIFYAGSGRLHVSGHDLFPGLPLNLLFSVAGVGLALIALMLMVTPGVRDRADDDLPLHAQKRKARIEEMSGKQHAVGGLWDDHEMDGGDDYDDYDDDERGYTGEYDADGYDDEDDDYDEPPARGAGPRRPAGRPPYAPRNRW